MKTSGYFFSLFLVLLAVQAARPAGRQLTGQYAPTPTPPLPAEEARKKFVVPDGFEVRLFAAEPQVINPVAMTWDARGRLWVVELFEYPLGARPGQKSRDRVKILEDTDADGRADKVTVFADGLNLATGIQLGNDGVYVGQAPDLLFLEDTNGDDRADKRTVFLTGFGLNDRHELLNGFTWGPDGALYMTHGVFTHSKVKDPNDPNDDGVVMNAAVARVDPLTKKFEVFADGTSNPWGVDFDRAGNAFVSACVIDHLFHMAPGAHYVRQGGQSLNPYAYQLLPSIVDHKHYRAAYAGIQIYEGNQYPNEYRGTVFMGNIHQSAINHDRLTPDGSSFKASALPDFLVSKDGWFRPVSTQTGPDGALWIMDWYDKYPCYQNANADPEGVDRTYGRIWRVVYTGDHPGTKVPSRPAVDMDLSKLTTGELVNLLSSDNSWQRRMAQRLLDERRDPEAVPLLRKMLRDGRSLESRLAALWTLYASGQLDGATLDPLAEDSEPAIRTWAARLTGERGRGNVRAIDRLLKLAADSDPSVRTAVATALREFSSGNLAVDVPPGPEAAKADIYAVAGVLLQKAPAPDDELFGHILWMALEPKVAWDPQPMFDLLAATKTQPSPATFGLARNTMRRVIDTRQVGNLNLAVKALPSLAQRDPALASAAIDGLIEGQKGRTVVPGIPSEPILTRLARSDNAALAERARQLGAIWGDAQATAAALAKINDPRAREEERLQGIRIARQVKQPAAREALLELVRHGGPPRLLTAAVRALGEIGGEGVDETFVAHWSTLPSPARSAAVEVLASRRPWARTLLDAVERKVISTTDISAPVVRSLAQSGDPALRKRAEQLIGRFRPSDTDKLKLIAAKKQVVLNGPVDLQAGHELAAKTCFVCHKLYGEGAEVGPDLTGVGRSSLDALLANVIDPNQVVGKGYENTEVETKDGRTLNGRIVEDTDTRLKLLASGPREEVVAKSDIATIRTTDLSLMPEGLEQLPDADFRNLIWYILNPPQESRPLQLEPGKDRMVVRAVLPGSEHAVDLVTAVLDPSKRSYLHPVMDPSGTVVLTEDEPPDHPWQHGIFTGLHRVNGLDFWTEKEGQQHFVRLLNGVQEDDHVGWTALNRWLAPDGSTVLEEEQTITVYRPDSTRQYRVDFDWLLRAKDKPVHIGRYDYGGFSVRLAFDSRHTHLNSAGQRDGSTANQRSSWVDVSRPFNDRVEGITVFDHPDNFRYPSEWRVDAQGLVNPSPSLQGDWTIEPGGERLFKYRLLVHQGKPDPKVWRQEFERFAARELTEDAQPMASDHESVALWNPEWKVLCPDFEGAPRALPEYAGRRNVLMTHPVDRDTGSALERGIPVPAGRKTALEFSVAAHEKGDWELRVLINGKEVQRKLVNKEGGRWKDIKVDLSSFAGQTVTVRLENCANNWSWEFGYWNNLRLASED